MAKALSILAIIFIINSAALCHAQSAGKNCCIASGEVRATCCPVGQFCLNGECHSASRKITDAAKIPQDVHDVICPKVGYKCPDYNTCCNMTGGRVGCCPLPNAVCCSDGEHCCPESTTCDLESQTCKPRNSEHASKQSKVKVNDVCPDKEQCPGVETCCKMATGDYGCCPYANATCCPDELTCCPHDYACASGGFCIRKDQKPSQEDKQENWCPGGIPCDKGTCCPSVIYYYGCCPLPNAVCCSDGLSCCPHGYTCNLAQQSCDPKKEIPIGLKFLQNLFAPMSRVKARK